ncbi:prolyl 3-hydroxylase sudestada1 [Pectinophora gossypiella]|uniref:prolyl 3-hydroxylase sudestada1 n=1 Tax=Pectinophora gossypiella TaxID=13191 RepID=UPI00214E89B2|nr:prolyl 3-hydroxylase sudestada1 [Pectinophora gossypiella]
MSSPQKDIEEPTSSNDVKGAEENAGKEEVTAAPEPRPPAKRPLSSTVIEISDTESDDSDVCAVTSYQASADEVKRIRGADYSSSSSSSSSGSYSSDSESPWEDDSLLVAEPRVRGKLPRACLNPRASRTDDPLLNPALKSQELIDRLKTHWKEQKDMSTSEVSLTCDPFRLVLLHDLLSNADIINNMVDDMNTLDWTRKKMDLYEFHQTVDLASLTWQRSIKGIYELLKTEIMSWVSEVMGLELVSVSASCSLYGPGDHLLVHDDMMSDRRVAFVLYLAPWRCTYTTVHTVHNGDGDHSTSDQAEGGGGGGGWSAAMGGALRLRARDGAGRAGGAARAVLPRNNMLALFKVGPDSFHQVEEVVSLEIPRLSINGWFHGPAPPTDPAPPPPPPYEPPPLLKPHNQVVVLSEWVDSAYMSPVSRAAVQAQMERDSEVSLRAFLLPERRRQLLEALQSPEVEWEHVGPANERRYCRVKLDGLEAGAAPPAGPAPWAGAGAVRALLQLAGAAAWLRLLQDCTDLQLRHYQRLELQRWQRGDFTLLPPRSHYQEARLEAVLYLGVPERTLCGGCTTYVAPEEEGEPEAEGGALVTVPPVDNALTLVYCDAGAASFTKYLSKMTMRPDECFYILTCTYKE